MAGGYGSTSKFANMEEWLVSPYEVLIEQAAAEGLTTSPPTLLAPESSSMAAARTAADSRSSSKGELSDCEMRSAISGHPQFKDLVRAHLNCRKVGASSDLAAQMDAQCMKYELEIAVKTTIGADPELDQFMVAYCNVLNACEMELLRTFKEAMEFCKNQEQKLNIITVRNEDVLSSAENEDMDMDASGSSDYMLMEEAESRVVDSLLGDKELKQMLMRKYGTYIKGLTQEYLKKKKKGKLPKESRQQLLDWWAQHQDHPYPNENQKASLAQTTGLEPKQINNWFINQRKRHWNPQAMRGESSQQQNDTKSSS